MIFLGTAFYNKENNSLFGILINQYDKTGAGRVTFKIIDAEDLETELQKYELAGLNIQDTMLLSDNPNYYLCDREKYNFFKDYIRNITDSRKLDLIDFVKHLVDVGGLILPEFYNTEKFTGKEYVAAENLKVSNSSINIYAPYVVNDTWDVLSLYDSANLRPKQFYAAVPHGENLFQFGTSVFYQKTIELDEQSYDVYACNIDISPDLEVSDSFVNYLAFRVAEKSIYSKILNNYLDEVYNNSAKPKYKSKENPNYGGRKKNNIEVQHSLSRFKNYELAMEIANSDTTKFHSKEIELVVTFIRDIRERIESEGGNILKVCAPLNYSFKEEILNNSLELLAVRYSLFPILNGRTIETTYATVRGGGVFGDTVLKRVGW